jgi:hypothetical protein
LTGCRSHQSTDQKKNPDGHKENWQQDWGGY